MNLEEKKVAYLNEAKSRYIRPLVFNRFNAPWEVMDGHSYPKGAAVLHVLRAVVGDAPFFRALSLFLHRYEFKSADTHDLMEAFKDATGRNVDWFFDQWVFRPGHPVFEVSWTWDDAGHKAKVKIIQAQDTAKGIPIYRMPVRIGFFTASGKRVETIELSKKKKRNSNSTVRPGPFSSVSTMATSSSKRFPSPSPGRSCSISSAMTTPAAE